MKLVDRVQWHDEVIEAPPVKLDDSSRIVPADTELTLIGVRHHTDGGQPDYVADMLQRHDILILEQPAWTKQRLRRMQEVSRGSHVAFKETTSALTAKSLDPGPHEWIMSVYKQLYGTGVRFAFTDYPQGHPEARALHFALTGPRGDSPEFYPLYRRRELFMAKDMASSIQEMRKYLKGFAEKKPLRAVAILGAAHYAIGEALARSAVAQDVGSFTVRTLFEESTSMLTSEIESPASLARIRAFTVNYQNWLRTPEG